MNMFRWKKRIAGPLANGVLDPQQRGPGSQSLVFGYLALAQ